MIPRCASITGYGDREFVNLFFIRVWFVLSIDSDVDCKYVIQFITSSQ